ncbi:MAG TPA: metal-dependent hydrolase [Terriglobia bacterium]|nr:metal-dependent hydrolase [Terriglobia bacterium]
MDNVTHTLTAVAISQTGLNRKTRFATLTLILAANAPDIDILSSLKDSITYLKYHRGISHSFIGITVLAIIIWGFISWVGKKVQPKPGLPLNGRWLLLAAFLGTGSHLLLDYTNAYGVRPFLPFSGRWYAWDIMSIIDPLLLAVLMVGLSVPWLLRLVSEEVGARKPRWGPGAVFCLSAMVALWGIRDFAHRRALSILDSHTYSGEDPQRFSALPVAVNPFTWMGVVETEGPFHVVRVDALDAKGLPEEMGTFEKPSMSPALAAAMKTRAGKIFLDFARFPWAQVDESEERYGVSLRDLRFYHDAAKSRGFTLEVELDKNLRTRSEAFYFVAPRSGTRDTGHGARD